MSAHYKGGGGASDPVVTTLGAAAQTISATVTDGEGKGLAIIRGRLINASGSNRNLTVLINGAATNVAMVQANGAGGVAGSSDGIAAFLRASAVCNFTLVFHTKSGTDRVGHGVFSCPDAGAIFATVKCSILYNDTSTVITSIGIDGGAAGTLDAGSLISIEEQDIH